MYDIENLNLQPLTSISAGTLELESPAGGTIAFVNGQMHFPFADNESQIKSSGRNNSLSTDFTKFPDFINHGLSPSCMAFSAS